jgi:hypothetical protein
MASITQIVSKPELLEKFKAILVGDTPVLWSSLTRDEKQLFEFYKQQACAG